MIIKYGIKEVAEEREKKAEKILNSLPYRYCFIVGSFLFKEKYKDIDVFVITRSKKEVKLKNKYVNITRLDFNNLYSLLYHSAKKECIAKNILPEWPLKATIANYWDIVNEAVPTIFNEKNKYHKEIRDLVLYTEYFRSGKVLSSHELTSNIAKFKNYKEILDYIRSETPKIITNKISKGYIKRFFYTWAGLYRDMIKYKAQKYLYYLAHDIVSKAM